MYASLNFTFTFMEKANCPNDASHMSLLLGNKAGPTGTNKLTKVFWKQNYF